VIRRIELYYDGGALSLRNGDVVACETAATTTAPTDGLADVAAKTRNVLIEFRHGLGDAVQLTNAWPGRQKLHRLGSVRERFSQHGSCGVRRQPFDGLLGNSG
jgi:hypothetical protein